MEKKSPMSYSALHKASNPITPLQGNLFVAKLNEAKEKGAKSFVVNGKEYPVQGSNSPAEFKIDGKAVGQAVKDATEYRNYVEKQTAPYDPEKTNLDKEGYERQQKVKGIQSYNRYHLGKQVQDQGGRSPKAKKAREVFFGVNTENAVEGGYPTFRNPEKIKQIKKSLNIK